MSLCVLEAEINENMKFANFAGGHFGNDVIQIVHPILVMVASIFHGERGPMNKIKQVPYYPGGGGAWGVYRAHGLILKHIACRNNYSILCPLLKFLKSKKNFLKKLVISNIFY